MTDDLLEMDELAALLRRHTAHLVSGPDVLDGARARGRRRLWHRRTIAGLAALALVFGGVGAVGLVSGPALDRAETFTGADPVGPFVDHPTRGDLAQDHAYLTSVLKAWDRSHGNSQNRDRGIFDDLRGEAWVAWAGNTPAGRAALVAQKAFLHEHDNIQLDSEGVTTLLGFVGVDSAGDLAVVGDTYPAPGVNPTTAWFVDPEHTVLAALAEGQPLGYGTGWIYRSDGRAVHQFKPMTTQDGVALATGLTGGKEARVYVSVLPARNAAELRDVVNNHFVPQSPPVERRLPWQGTPQHPFSPLLDLDGTRACGTETTRVDIEALDKAWMTNVADKNANTASLGMSTWHACGTLPDGRRIVLGEQQLDADASRLLALIGGSTVLDLGELDPRAPLPVAARVPGGWAVAAYGASLRGRAGKGPWTASRADAALLAVSTSEVEVTRNGVVTVIELPH